MNTDVCVKPSLTFGAYSFTETVAEGSMIRQLWEAMLDLGVSAERKLQRRERERRLEERLDENKRRDDQKHAEFVDLLLVADPLRRAQEELSRDLGDAITAVRLAHARAERGQELARDALNAATQGAIRLSEGQRVYFTADGQRLYSEDRREISDERLVQQALSAKTAAPDATTYEEYIAWHDRAAAATAEVETLAEALDRLDSIQLRLKNGDLTVEDLDQLRREKEDVVQSLPLDVRSEYDRMKARRTPAYHALAPEVEAALDLTGSFAEAHGVSPSTPDAPIPNRIPAYKSVPDF